MPRTSENIRLTTKQQAALACLLQGGSQQQAADAAGVNVRTLYAWRQHPEFAAELRAGEQELIASAVRALSALTRPAAGLLGRILADTEGKPSDRLRAAGLVLQHVMELKQLVDLEARVAALEAQGENHATS